MKIGNCKCGNGRWLMIDDRLQCDHCADPLIGAAGLESILARVLKEKAEARKKALEEAAEEADSHIISDPNDNAWDRAYNKAVKGIARHIRRLADSPAKEGSD